MLAKFVQEPARQTSRHPPDTPVPLSFRSARGGDFGRDDALVDAPSLTLPRARGREGVFEPFGDAPDATDVTAIEIGGEPPP